MPNVSVSGYGGGSLDQAINNALSGVDAVVMLSTKDAAKAAADSVVKQLKATSPKGKASKYAKSWKTKAQDGGQVIYNEKHYRLTHLLENGHDVVVNGKKVGHAKAYPHIKPAEEKGIKDFEQKIRENVERRLGT